MTYESQELAEIVNNFDILISLRKRNFNKKAHTGRFFRISGYPPRKDASLGGGDFSDFSPHGRGLRAPNRAIGD
jgi:hypothetical protein